MESNKKYGTVVQTSEVYKGLTEPGERAIKHRASVRPGDGISGGKEKKMKIAVFERFQITLYKDR